MKVYRASRLKQLIFPQELMIDKYHVLARKRRFPAFWVVTEESIPLSKLASIQIQKGILFSKLTIENSGGPYPIVVDGLWNNAAKEIPQSAGTNRAGYAGRRCGLPGRGR